MATAGTRALGEGAAVWAALQVVAQGLPQLQEAMQQDWLEALRQQEQKAREDTQRTVRLLEQEVNRRLQEIKREMEGRYEAVRTIARKMEKILGKVERKLVHLERLVPPSGERQSNEGAGGWEAVQHLEGRVTALEASVQRALESVFPRVDALVAQLEERSPPEAPDTCKPRPSISSASWSAASFSSNSESSSATTSQPSEASESQTSATSISTTSSPTTAPEVSSAPVPCPSRAVGSKPFSASAPSGHADLDRQRSLGEELLKAATEGRVKEVRKLLDAGAEVNYSDSVNKWTPLIRASCNGHDLVLWLLLERGADVHIKGGPPRWTALHHAAQSDVSGQCVTVLVAAGAHLEDKTVEWWTPLHVAAHYNNEAAVRALVAVGASKTMRDKRGNTPFDCARSDAVRRILHH